MEHCFYQCTFVGSVVCHITAQRLIEPNIRHVLLAAAAASAIVVVVVVVVVVVAVSAVSAM